MSQENYTPEEIRRIKKLLKQERDEYHSLELRETTVLIVKLESIGWDMTSFKQRFKWFQEDIEKHGMGSGVLNDLRRIITIFERNEDVVGKIEPKNFEGSLIDALTTLAELNLLDETDKLRLKGWVKWMY